MRQQIERGQDFAQGAGCQTLAEWREQLIRMPRMKAMMRALRWRYTGEVGGAPVLARIRQARWLALCECGGAERTDPDEPAFYCFSCGNVGADGNLRPVIFPGNVQEIETVLSARPFPINRNWEPGETAKDLLEENRNHGLDGEALTIQL